MAPSNNKSRVKPGTLVEVTRAGGGHNYKVGCKYEVTSVHKTNMGGGGSVMARTPSTGRVGNYLPMSCFRIVSGSKTKATKGVKPIKGETIMERLVIPPELKTLVLETIQQAKHDTSHLIFEKWGFGSKLEKGKGAIILLYGPPGTGKTMCAEGIAEILGKKYMILSSGNFQSAIPGQTERNIQEAFGKAKKENLIIVLDECDSVCYNRNEVGAILAAEINALLTEIERFDGVCILTTNRNQRLDPALERRVCLKLEFDRPDRDARRQIWKNLLPKQAPLGKCVDLDLLSEHDLTGGQIKNAILLAARRAASEKVAKESERKIKQLHLLEGIKREVLGQSAFDASNAYKVMGSGLRRATSDKVHAEELDESGQVRAEIREA